MVTFHRFRVYTVLRTTKTLVWLPVAPRLNGVEGWHWLRYGIVHLPTDEQALVCAQTVKSTLEDLAFSS